MLGDETRPAALLWFYTGWYAGAILAEFLGVAPRWVHRSGPPWPASSRVTHAGSSGSPAARPLPRRRSRRFPRPPDLDPRRAAGPLQRDERRVPVVTRRSSISAVWSTGSGLSPGSSSPGEEDGERGAPDRPAGSSTRSPPIARHSDRETYSPSPVPSALAPGGAALVALEDPVAVLRPHARPAVGDGHRERPSSARGATGAWIAAPPAYRALLSSSAQSTWSSWSGSAIASQPPASSSSSNGTPATPSASQARRTRGASARTSVADFSVPDSRPRHRHELADDPVQPVGLLDDDPEPLVGSLRPHLLGVGADARERRLQVVADAAQELVLRLVELDELGAGRSTCSNSSRFRIATATSLAYSSRRSWSAGPSAASPAGGRRARRAARRAARGRRGSAATRRGCPPRRAPSSGRRARSGHRSCRTPPARSAWRARRAAPGRRAATSRRSRAGSARAPGSAARDRRRGGCGSRRAGPARRRPATSTRTERSPDDVRSTGRETARSGAVRLPARR